MVSSGPFQIDTTNRHGKATVESLVASQFVFRHKGLGHVHVGALLEKVQHVMLAGVLKNLILSRFQIKTKEGKLTGTMRPRPIGIRLLFELMFSLHARYALVGNWRICFSNTMDL